MSDELPDDRLPDIELAQYPGEPLRGGRCHHCNGDVPPSPSGWAIVCNVAGRLADPYTDSNCYVCDACADQRAPGLGHLRRGLALLPIPKPAALNDMLEQGLAYAVIMSAVERMVSALRRKE
jgi:hypothetical protein